MKRIFLIILTLAVLTPYHVFALTYNLAPSNTTIKFKIKNFGIMYVKGSFEKFKGTVDIDETDITKSRVDVSIDIASINTGINKRDDDLRSSNFFEVAKFPAMKFISTKIEKDGADKLKLFGNLTIKGVTKPVVLAVEGPSGEAAGVRSDFARAASATATINRQDFGISYGSVIGDEVFITINTQLNKE
jgi:polyisoprenoid-binding protein YceI